MLKCIETSIVFVLRRFSASVHVMPGFSMSPSPAHYEYSYIPSLLPKTRRDAIRVNFSVRFSSLHFFYFSGKASLWLFLRAYLSWKWCLSFAGCSKLREGEGRKHFFVRTSSCNRLSSSRTKMKHFCKRQIFISLQFGPNANCKRPIRSRESATNEIKCTPQHLTDYPLDKETERFLPACPIWIAAESQCMHFGYGIDERSASASFLFYFISFGWFAIARGSSHGMSERGGASVACFFSTSRFATKLFDHFHAKFVWSCLKISKYPVSVIWISE